MPETNSICLPLSLSLSFAPFFGNAANKEEMKFGTLKKKKRIKKETLVHAASFFVVFTQIHTHTHRRIYFEVSTNFYILSVVVVAATTRSPSSS